MSDYATLAGTAGTLNFMMDPDWQPGIPEKGALWYPLGYGFAVKSTDGTKGIGGQFTMVTTSHSDDVLARSLLEESGTLTLTLPTGDSWTIVIDPATERTGKAQFSLMLWQWVNVWTVKYAQAA